MTERRSTRRRPEPIGGLVGALLAKWGIAERVERATVITDWERLVGTHIARVSRPVRIREDTLFVEVESAAWRMELSLLRPRLMRQVECRQAHGTDREDRFPAVGWTALGGDGWRRVTVRRARQRSRTATPRDTCRCSRAWKPSASDPECTSGRPRPGDLHHLVYEVVDNAIDEAMAGYCSEIGVVIHEDDSITVIDDGRGIPVDSTRRRRFRESNWPSHACTQAGSSTRTATRFPAGLHGVGVSVVNALSESLDVEVKRDGYVWTQEFSRGVKRTDLDKGSKTKETGTTVHFKPDSEIFTELQYQWDTLATRLRELAYLNRGVAIVLRDERPEEWKTTARRDSFRGRASASMWSTCGARRALCTTTSFIWKAIRTAPRSSWPCSTRTGTTRTRSPSSTTSIRTREEHISAGSRRP